MGGEGVLEEGSWGGSLAPRIIGAGVGEVVADLRESEERLEVERVGIRVGGADCCCCCCCRDDGRGIMLDGTDTGVKLRASPVPGVASGIGVLLSSTSGI